MRYLGQDRTVFLWYLDRDEEKKITAFYGSFLGTVVNKAKFKKIVSCINLKFYSLKKIASNFRSLKCVLPKFTYKLFCPAEIPHENYSVPAEIQHKNCSVPAKIPHKVFALF